MNPILGFFLVIFGLMTLVLLPFVIYDYIWYKNLRKLEYKKFISCEGYLETPGCHILVKCLKKPIVFANGVYWCGDWTCKWNKERLENK